MTKTCRILGLVVASTLLASCGLFSDKDEELEPKELVRIEDKVKIRRSWSAKLGSDSDYLRIALRPVGDGSRIYAASQNGNVLAFDPATGKQLWRTKLDTELTAGPGVGGGRVVVVARNGQAILLDAADGSEQWRVGISGESLARPLISGETVILQTADNRLLALSLFDGRQRWAITQTTPVLTMRGSSSPVVIGTTVIAGFDNGRLVAADLSTGDIVWDSLLSPPTGRSDLDRLADIDGAMAVVGQDLYAAGYQGRLAAIASESGQILWNREISSYEGVAADWNSVYTVRDDGEVIALERRNGAELWRNDSLLRREPTLPVPFHTMVVVGDLDGYLHFFNNFDGEPMARVRQGGKAITSDPIVLGNRLYVQGDDGSLAAYEVVEDRPKRAAPDIAADEN